MPFLTIAGVTIPVAAKEASESQVLIGEKARAFDGSLRSMIRARKREWALQTPVLARASAEAIKGLVQGLGHRIPLDADAYSDKGLAPSSGAGNLTIGNSGPTPKWGTGRGAVAAGLATAWPALVGAAQWTVMLYRSNGAVWNHYVVDSSGRKWLNTTRADATSTTWLSVGSGAVALAGDGAAPGYYDDVVILPYLLDASWPPLFSARTAAFPALPRLVVTGDLFQGSGVIVEGELGTCSLIPAAPGGVMQNNAMQVEFTLAEV
ncbi:MAG: hypothetical protein ACK4N5_02225 [Myxococcales bacterium]